MVPLSAKKLGAAHGNCSPGTLGICLWVPWMPPVFDHPCGGCSSFSEVIVVLLHCFYLARLDAAGRPFRDRGRETRSVGNGVESVGCLKYLAVCASNPGWVLDRARHEGVPPAAERKSDDGEPLNVRGWLQDGLNNWIPPANV